MTNFSNESVLYDNTRLSEYKRCPRAYYIRHVMHWTTEGTGVALTFGSAWHNGQDIVWKHAKQVDKMTLTELAYGAFLDTWIEAGLPESMEYGGYDRFGPRTPGTAKEMYFNYIKTRWDMLQDCEVIGIEQPFAVPLPDIENTWYVGRLDKTVRYNGQLLVLEHKTTAMYATQGGFRSDYIDSWYASSQVKGYQFGGGLFYPGLDAVWVDCALVHKKIHDEFRFVPVSHNVTLLHEWINTTKTWASKVTESVRQANAGIPLYLAFPKNEDNCFGKYGQCPFLDICRTCDDPRQLDTIPAGFVETKWEPFSLLGLDKLVNQSKQSNNGES